jgi:NitT/TauT family transport system substrate-binding protein
MAAGALLLAAAPITDAARAADKLVLQINWFHLADHSVYYLGKKKGYYAEENIDLTVLRGHGSGDTAKKMELKQADIGVAETGVVVTAISKGADLKLVGIVFDKPVNGIFSKASSNIRTPKDLIGKSIAAPPGDAHRTLWPAFCKANNLDCSTVTLVNVQPEGKQAIVASDQVTGAFDAYTGLNIWKKALGDNVAYLDWSQWGIGLYGHGYIVHTDTLKAKPDLVRRFLRATYKAWRDAKVDPRSSIEAMYGAEGVQPFDREIYLANLHLILDRVIAERAAQHGIGWIVEDVMQSTIDLTALGGQMGKALKAADVYTNEFNPKIMPPK